LTSLKARSSNIDDRFNEDLREAESLVTQLEIEGRAISSGSPEVKSRINLFKNDIQSLREKSLLLAGRTNAGASNRLDRRFMDDEEALERSSEV